MDRDDVIGTLNDLIETSKDGEEGFRTCADAVKTPQLKAFFEQKAERCRIGATQLQQKVRELGGDPERSGTISGSAAWTSTPCSTNASAARISPSAPTMRRCRMICQPMSGR